MQKRHQLRAHPLDLNAKVKAFEARRMRSRWLTAVLIPSGLIFYSTPASETSTLFYLVGYLDSRSGCVVCHGLARQARGLGSLVAASLRLKLE